MLKGMKIHEDKQHEKTLKHEAPRNINHKATKNKNKTGTIALEQNITSAVFQRQNDMSRDMTKPTK